MNRQFSHKEINTDKDLLANKHRKSLCPHIPKMQNFKILLKIILPIFFLKSPKLRVLIFKCGELVGNKLLLGQLAKMTYRLVRGDLILCIKI